MLTPVNLCSLLNRSWLNIRYNILYITCVCLLCHYRHLLFLIIALRQSAVSMYFSNSHPFIPSLQSDKCVHLSLHNCLLILCGAQPATSVCSCICTYKLLGARQVSVAHKPASIFPFTFPYITGIWPRSGSQITNFSCVQACTCDLEPNRTLIFTLTFLFIMSGLY